MRVCWTGIPLLFFSLVTWGCTKGPSTPPPALAASVSSVRSGSLDVAGEQATEDEEEDDDDASADRVRPCGIDSDDHEDGRAALDAIDARVDLLKDADDPTPLRDELEALLAHPCFELAGADPKEPLEFDSGLALRTWWSEGGRSWLNTYLDLERSHYVMEAGTPRKTLTTMTAAKDHPLRPLLCASTASDDKCGRETVGWMRRADEKFTIVSERSTGSFTNCMDEAKKAKRSQRYSAYRSCMDTTRTSRRALPIGRFKAPADGWLAMYTEVRYCNVLSAYDLATGTRYRMRDCSNAKSPVVTVGRVPLAALREAAWMFALAGETQGGVRGTSYVSIPEEISIERDRGEPWELGSIGTSGGHWEQHSWAWLRDPKGTGTLRAQTEGEFRRPPHEAFEHALSLLEVADDGFEEGCAPALPPSRVVWGPAEHTVPIVARARPTSRTCTAKP